VQNYSTLTPAEQLSYRKRREICRKLGSLRGELKSWLDRSEEGQPLEKHYTQIRAVHAHLSQWSRNVRRLVRDGMRQGANTFFDSIYDVERLILSEHRIWEFFRGKFIQREEAGFRRYLKVADEFAWSCYGPVQRHVYPDPANAARKEPPLVYFNGGSSPFSFSRGREFKPEDVPFAGEGLTGTELAVANLLPIPLVGIPWYQIAHLPEAVVIGHEVGHIVEDDFGLTGRLEVLLHEAVAEAGAERRQGAWSAWLGEVFADVYGCLSAGPAFVGALMDFLTRDFAELSEESKTEEDWGRYPTTYLRGRILIRILEEMGFNREAAGYKDLWGNFSSSMPPEFVDDINFLVPKLMSAPLFDGATPGVAGKSLREVFNFTRRQQDAVVSTVEQLEKGLTLTTRDVRVLFAAARTSFEADPKRFTLKGYEELLLARLEAPDVMQAGTRRIQEPPISQHELKKKLQGYEQSAQLLIDELRKRDARPRTRPR
jgi:hypothetical protein